MTSIGNALSNFTSQSGVSSAGKQHDFTAMSPSQMLSVKNDLVSSGKISLTQSLDIDGMIDVPMEGGGGAVPEPASWMTQATNWYQSLDDMIASAKAAGDVTANATVKELAGLKSVLLSLQENQGTADTTG